MFSGCPVDTHMRCTAQTRFSPCLPHASLFHGLSPRLLAYSVFPARSAGTVGGFRLVSFTNSIRARFQVGSYAIAKGAWFQSFWAKRPAEIFSAHHWNCAPTCLLRSGTSKKLRLRKKVRLGDKSAIEKGADAEKVIHDALSSSCPLPSGIEDERSSERSSSSNSSITCSLVISDGKRSITKPISRLETPHKEALQSLAQRTLRMYNNSKILQGSQDMKPDAPDTNAAGQMEPDLEAHVNSTKDVAGNPVIESRTPREFGWCVWADRYVSYMTFSPFSLERLSCL